MGFHGPILACVAVGLAVGFGVHLLPRLAARSAAPMAVREEPAQAQSHIDAQPRRELGLMPAQESRPQHDAPQREPAAQMVFAPPDSPDALAEFEEARAQSALARKELLAAVAASFSREARDQRWSNDVTESVRVILGGDEFAGVSLQHIDCRTRTCRIELQDGDSGHLPMTLPMLAVQMAGSLPNMLVDYVDQPDGKKTAILYLSR
jgi:hypothetical protein